MPPNNACAFLFPGADYFESVVQDINDAGLVVGYGKLNLGGTRAIAWTLVDKSVVPLELDEGPALRDSTGAWSVSADGAIAGNGEVLDDNDERSVRGLYWNSVLETPILLTRPAGYGRCWPLGMSSDGVLVVGVATKLDSLAGSSSFNKLTEARGINDSGDMVGIGWSNVSEHHAFLMIKN